jgi:hypothetical protein
VPTQNAIMEIMTSVMMLGREGLSVNRLRLTAKGSATGCCGGMEAPELRGAGLAAG